VCRQKREIFALRQAVLRKTVAQSGGANQDGTHLPDGVEVAF
jgi:hypothetical protein